jgi:hypothetical protein
MPILSTQLNSASTNSTQFVDIPGLSITLPPATETVKHALVTLNVPAAMSSGIDAVDFAINFNGNIIASGSANFLIRVSGDLIGTPLAESITIVDRVKLGAGNTTVRAQWKVANSRSTARISSFAGFSATVA